MNENAFSGFNLAGGTALALQIGHRNSVDIDMFGSSEIKPALFYDILSGFGEIAERQSSTNIYISEINKIKVDFVNYSNFPQIDEIIEIQGIRMFTPKEIAAMKLNAISGRGSKKDFIDLYFLLKTFTLEEMIGFYREKYTDASEFMMLKSLSYFGDADLQPEPKVFKEFNWEECKNTILQEVNKL
jgi:hypothetical protein